MKTTVTIRRIGGERLLPPRWGVWAENAEGGVRWPATFHSEFTARLCADTLAPFLRGLTGDEVEVVGP